MLQTNPSQNRAARMQRNKYKETRSADSAELCLDLVAGRCAPNKGRRERRGETRTAKAIVVVKASERTASKATSTFSWCTVPTCELGRLKP